jgi:hypothetical protein
MAMPEAAVNKDGGLELGQDDVRTAWEFSDMQPKAIAHAMQQRPDNFFRRSVSATNAAHIP